MWQSSNTDHTEIKPKIQKPEKWETLQTRRLDVVLFWSDLTELNYTFKELFIWIDISQMGPKIQTKKMSFCVISYLWLKYLSSGHPWVVFECVWNLYPSNRGADVPQREDWKEEGQGVPLVLHFLFASNRISFKKAFVCFCFHSSANT